jgi:hypothetical protein
MTDEPKWSPIGATEADLPQGPEQGKVAICYLSGTDVSNGFMMSMLNLRDADQTQGWNRLDDHWWINQRSGVNVARTRNSAIRKFLALRPAPEWALLVDADMTFEPTALELLMMAVEHSRSDPDIPDINVIGGLCVAFGNKGDGSNEIQLISTIFDPGDERPGIPLPQFQMVPPKDVKFKAVRQVYGTGAAFLLVHRQVLIDIAAADGTLFPWFREDQIWDNRPDVQYHDRNDLWISEDLFFCLQVQRCGYPIFVHTGVQIGHVKSIKLTEDLWRYHSSLVEMA